MNNEFRGRVGVISDSYEHLRKVINDFPFDFRVILLYGVSRELSAIFLYKNYISDEEINKPSIEEVISLANCQLERVSVAASRLPKKPGELKNKHIKTAHGAVFGQLKSGFRKRPAFLGSELRRSQSFSPPSAHAIPALIGQANRWLSLPGIDWWLRISFYFAFFINIHPFADGNGRTAKALVLWLCGRDPGKLRMVSLLFIFHRITGREMLFPALHYMRQGDLSPYVDYVQYSLDWMADFVRDELNRGAGHQDDHSLHIVMRQCLSEHVEGKTY
ncbi:Fic family protein [Wenzhouxiangella marina]|uniref:Uncharacterized protein n=1 Tax=Wenzhouxiangella marina TaxID=1579979 RepID=A0A0K0XZQ1_9GAMM|nr:Fic family protein [Wenzhouxiangella marina]AKS43117.1 hypothetical protein WM2015_2760 [Wenzhouxiangella marina]MBB6087198.1 hypothetical protein [Wenzhouxiangella marina]